MATFDSDSLPAMPADPAFALELGYGQPMPSSFTDRWDKRPGRPEADYGWIGEDPHEGVWIAQHPDSALLRYPGLWPVIAEFRSGLREITQFDWENKSAFHFDAKLTLVDTYVRSLSKKGESDD